MSDLAGSNGWSDDKNVLPNYPYFQKGVGWYLTRDDINHGPSDSVIADSALQRAFAAATGNFQLFSALKSKHIWS